MPGLRLDRLIIDAPRATELQTRLWREWCFAKAVARRFGIRAAIIAAILFAGAGLFLWCEPESDHTFTEALFLTWALVFGEPPKDFPRSPLLQAVLFIVPALGLTVIIEGLVEFSLMVRDRRRVERNWCIMMGASMKDHVILVGLGRLGFLIFRLLRKLGVSVIVLERQPDNQFLDDVRRDGSPLLIGDARREKMLDEANVRAALAIILATTDDLANLEIALDARRVAPNIRVILRMFDQNMANKVGAGFNIRPAMSQAAISAPAFAMAALDPDIVSSFVVQDRLVVMKHWNVSPAGPLCGKTIAEAMREFGMGVVEYCPSHGEPQLFPSPDTLLRPGDRLIVQGPYEKLSEYSRRGRTAGARAEPPGAAPAGLAADGGHGNGPGSAG
jgi:voltage-gated potassium channel